MPFGLSRWQARVAVDDGLVDPTMLFEPSDGFDAGSDDRGSAVVSAAVDEVVKAREERRGQADSDLVGGHAQVYHLGMPFGVRITEASPLA